MPGKTREALQSILDSPVGDKIRASGVEIKLALTLDVNNTFEVVDGIIYYHTDVKGHLSSPMGEGLPQSSTLGSLLAHDVGHVIGGDDRHDEILTTRHFENSYRSHFNMPLRRSYNGKTVYGE